jgi:hypothetical protein
VPRKCQISVTKFEISQLAKIHSKIVKSLAKLLAI